MARTGHGARRSVVIKESEKVGFLDFAPYKLMPTEYAFGVRWRRKRPSGTPPLRVALRPASAAADQ
jgi:hypothetical protein